MFVYVCVYTNALVIKVKLLCREEFKAIKNAQQQQRQRVHL